VPDVRVPCALPPVPPRARRTVSVPPTVHEPGAAPSATPRPVRWTLVVRTAVAPLDARLLARALAAAVLSGGDTGAPRRHALAPGSARDGRSAARDPRAPLCAARQ
jgi:hypothetical protein